MLPVLPLTDYRHICELLSQIPPAVVVELITFTDMLDRKMPITMDNCSDRKVFITSNGTVMLVIQ